MNPSLLLRAASHWHSPSALRLTFVHSKNFVLSPSSSFQDYSLPNAGSSHNTTVNGREVVRQEEVPGQSMNHAGNFTTGLSLVSGMTPSNFVFLHSAYIELQSLSMEIDLFRALTVHSQWHPDLIAAAISTKTTWQVKQCLAALEDGAMHLQRIEDGDESPSNLADIDTDQDDSNSDLNVEPAYQVSEAWIAAQEALTAYVIKEENAALLKCYRGTASDRKKAREKHLLGRLCINDGRKGHCPHY